MVPTLLILAAVAALPLYRTFFYSVTDANILTLSSGYNFVALDNFKKIMSDPDWWTSVKNTLLFAGVSVSLETLLGLMVAMALNQEFVGRSFLRAAILVPWAIPTVVSARMWTWMFNDLYGVINDVLMKFGFIQEKIAWLVHDNLSMMSLVFVDVWKTTPFMALLILAGLQGIPKSVLEAARVDCPSRLKIFFRITLPLLKPALVVAVIFRALDALRVFDLFYVMTGNKTSTASMSVYARKQLIDFQDFGYGSAVSVVIFFIIGFFTIIYMNFSKADFSGGEAST
jgi:trehalose/maltose transport system permease protein